MIRHAAVCIIRELRSFAEDMVFEIRLPDLEKAELCTKLDRGLARWRAT